jgi:SOS-response transcriptional repressor LexA
MIKLFAMIISKGEDKIKLMDLEKRLANLDEAEKFAEWLRGKLRATGMTLRELSRRSGITYSHIYRLSQGLAKPTIDTILKIAEAFGAKEEAMRLFLGIEIIEGISSAEPPIVSEATASYAPNFRLIPIVAEVPCGKSIEIKEARYGYLLQPIGEARGAVFAIRAKGDSMAPEIRDGDFLLVRPQPAAEDGDIIVVSIETDGGWESMVKRYRIRNGEPILESLNPVYPPIPLKRKRVRIVGKVIEIRRFL